MFEHWKTTDVPAGAYSSFGNFTEGGPRLFAVPFSDAAKAVAATHPKRATICPMADRGDMTEFPAVLVGSEQDLQALEDAAVNLLRRATGGGAPASRHRLALAI